MDKYMNTILPGDCLEVLKTLPDEFIDCCVTSPPYWGLRDYGVTGQLGLESSYYEYVEKLCQVFDEVKRVLKKQGTCWINLGDTYGGSGGYGKSAVINHSSTGFKQRIDGSKKSGSRNVAPKCLLQIPSRFAIEMIKREWLLRNVIIWHKPNCLPNSVKDRFTVDFEYVFFFVKSKKYYFDQDAIREPHGKDKRMSGLRRARELGYDGKGSYQDWYENKRVRKSWHDHSQDLTQGFAHQRRGKKVPHLVHPLGRNKRCVWTIPTRPYPGQHFATFPERLIEPMIIAGCPQGGIVLDPFMGSGTTAVVARKLKRNYTGIELNPEYIQQIKDRLNNSAEGGSNG